MIAKLKPSNLINCIHVNSNLSFTDGHKWAYPCQRCSTCTVLLLNTPVDEQGVH